MRVLHGRRRHLLHFHQQFAPGQRPRVTDAKALGQAPKELGVASGGAHYFHQRRGRSADQQHLALAAEVRHIGKPRVGRPFPTALLQAILLEFASNGLHVANKDVAGCVLLNAEVQTAFEDLHPGVGERPAEENDVVIGKLAHVDVAWVPHHHLGGRHRAGQLGGKLNAPGGDEPLILDDVPHFRGAAQGLPKFG